MVSFWQSIIYPLLASPATIGAVAIISAIAVFGIYYLRRRDAKRDAANIILLELKNSVTKLNEAREAYENARASNPEVISFPERLRLMPTSSWSKYKYLFVRDFKPEQWAAIGEYYDNCIAFDEALDHRDKNFYRNEAQIRAGLHANISAYSKELVEEIVPNPDNDVSKSAQNQQILDKYKVKRDGVIKANLHDLLYMYNPDKSFTDASYYFHLLPQNIIETPMGVKLERLASSLLKRK